MARRWRQPINDTEQIPRFNGVLENRMNHPAYTSRAALADTPPSVRIGLRLACSPIPPDQPSTSELRHAMLRVLSQPTITGFVTELTHIEGLKWQSRDCHGRHNQGAVLTNGDDEVAPPAWARILLPDPTVSPPGRNSQCAHFVLNIEPRTPRSKLTPPRDLTWWQKAFSSAFSVLEVVSAHLLVRELRLTTSQDPADELAVRLDASHDLTEIIEINRYKRVAGTHIARSFVICAVADDNGLIPAKLATQWLRQLCDTALHLDDYERTLLTFGSA